MYKPVFFKGIVEFNNVISQDTHHIRIKPEIPNFMFDAGQFVTITVGPMIKRSYSIASKPGSDTFDLIGDTKMGGPGSQFFASAKEGQEVEVLGPLGLFTYKPTDRDVIFWATGTGVVPFMAMAPSVLENNPNKKIILISSFKFKEDIFGDEYFADLAKSNPNFDYKVYVTRPTDDWKGLSGRVTEFMPQLEGGKAAMYDHYLCGTKLMIDDVVLRLESMGVSKDQMHYEKFY